MKRNRRKHSKQMMAFLLALALVVSGLYVYPKEAEAADAVTVAVSQGQTYVEKRSLNSYIGKRAPKPTKEGFENWIFAGWYKQEACTTPITDTTTTGTYYAKYVPEEVLSVKYQVKTGTSASTTSTPLRVISTVDTLNYHRVGFKIAIDDISYSTTHQSKIVYKNIKANSNSVAFTYGPDIFQYELSEYFITATISSVPKAAFDCDIRITPYWITLDGVTVDGLSRTIRVNDCYQETVNVPIRLYSDAAIAKSKTIKVSYNSDMYSFSGSDAGTLGNVYSVSDDGAGTVTCTNTAALAAASGTTKGGADGMLTNLRFTKKDTTVPITIDDFGIASESVTTWNSSYEVYHNVELAVRDGQFSAENLYNHSTFWDSNSTQGTTALTTVKGTSSGTSVACLKGYHAGSGLKSVYVENLLLDPADFTKLSFKIKDNAGHSFNLWRLYINPDTSVTGTDSTAQTARRGTQVVGTDNNLNATAVTVSAADADGWYTVTMDLSKVSAWTSAGSITGLNLGYTTSGKNQYVQSISFTNTDAHFSAEELYEQSKGVHTNLTALQSEKSLHDTGVKYDFLDYAHGALRTVYMENLALDPTLYDKVLIRIRPLSKDKKDALWDFNLWRLYINPDSTQTTAPEARGSLIINTVETEDEPVRNSDNVEVSAADSDGWITVTMYLRDMTTLWRGAGTITGFVLGYRNYGVEHEIGGIEFVKSNTTTAEYPAVRLYDFGMPIYNNNVPGNNVTETLSNTGSVKYYIAGSGSLKSIYMENIPQLCTSASESATGAEALPGTYNTIKMKIRGTDGGEFTLWRLYINPDSDASTTNDDTGRAARRGTQIVNTGTISSAAGTYSGVTVSEADADGWITVTYDLSSITAWTDATSITGIHIGFLYSMQNVEVESITFDTN